jgi:hypothetical protein
MWEFRLFSRDPLGEVIRPEVTDYFRQAPLETRTDDYFNYHNVEMGLKERGLSRLSRSSEEIRGPLLELKIRIDKANWGAELWKKWEIPLKQTLKKQRDKEIQLIISSLNRVKGNIYRIYLPKYKACQDIIKQKSMEHVEVAKQRHQITAFYTFENNKWEYIPMADKDICRHPPYGLLIEFTQLSIKGELWDTIAVEGKQADLVKRFLEENLVLSVKHLQNEICGYPTFLDRYSPVTTDQEAPVYATVGPQHASGRLHAYLR